jgi:APA family basic amino acid/polyamine antiporter
VRRAPVNGGEASLLRFFFSPALGEIAGWVSFVIGFAASNAASAIGFGAYFGKAFPLLEWPLKGQAFAAILAVTLLHSITGPLGMRVQTGMAVLKFSLLTILTGWGLFLHQPAAEVALALQEAPAGAAFGPAWGLAIMFSMFAYLGWSAAVYSAAETREAGRTVPKAMLWGTCIVLLLYLGVNLALLRQIPLGELVREKAVIELLFRKLFGPGASPLFSGLVSFALLSSLGASAFLGPRVLHAMLRWYRPAVPQQSPDQRPEAVPRRLVWLQAALSLGMIVSGTFEQILTVTGFLLGIFPMLTVLGLYTDRANTPERVSLFARAFAAPMFLAGSLLILVLGALEKPAEMVVASTLVLLIFWFRRPSPPSHGAPPREI